MLPESFIEKFRLRKRAGRRNARLDSSCTGHTVNLTFSALSALKGMRKIFSYSTCELMILLHFKLLTCLSRNDIFGPGCQV